MSLPPPTSYGQGPTPTGFGQIKHGKFTSTIYGMIRDSRFHEVVALLKNELISYPNSRAGLSLLAYCYYEMQEFDESAATYDKLCEAFPTAEIYRFYYSQALFKSGDLNMAMKVTMLIQESAILGDKVKQLQACIKFAMGDIDGARHFVSSCAQESKDTMLNQACLLVRDEKYEGAIAKYNDVIKKYGAHFFSLAYGLAYCNYKMNQMIIALKYVANVEEAAHKGFPEFANIGDKIVQNGQILHSSFLVEAHNLRACIEYKLKNIEAARLAIDTMPRRVEQDIDPISLHNLALLHVAANPSETFEKLNFLLYGASCPPEAFCNLLLLYIQHGNYDYAADLLAENPQNLASTIDPNIYDYIDAMLLKESSPVEGYNKLESVCSLRADGLRRQRQTIQDSRVTIDENVLKQSIQKYEDSMERFIPILMAQAKILWDKADYAQLEKLFRSHMDICADQAVWQLNVAHVLFMQEDKYRDAIAFYEPIVKKNSGKLLNVTAIVLANLCVAYIMTSQNEEAEELMRCIEKEEEELSFSKPGTPTFHLCIVNLVIGTLYSSKGNYEFGISRIIKSLEPFQKKLGTDTWYYAKRCFVSLFETLAKNMILLKDSMCQDILRFMDACETHGKNIPVEIDYSLANASIGAGQGNFTLKTAADAQTDPARNSVAYEARYLKTLFLKLYADN